MGGSGGGYLPSNIEEMRDLVAGQRAADQQQVDSAVNDRLQTLLSRYNDRDSDEVNRLLDAAVDSLSDNFEIDRLMFGGSVAKHTYVDGLSDVDALLIVKPGYVLRETPKAALKTIRKILNTALSGDVAHSVEAGRMAVTVTTRDNVEVQLLPAVRAGKSLLIPSEDGDSWRKADVKRFTRALSLANSRLGMSLVPTIKLFKALSANLPKSVQLKGHHIEALCVEAFKGYNGPKTPKAMLTHALTEGAKRVMRPIADITGQSTYLDDYMGNAASKRRSATSNALTLLAKRLSRTSSVDDWDAAFYSE